MADSVTDHSTLLSGIAFQEECLNLHWQLNQAKDLEVRGFESRSGSNFSLGF